jgi:hypothetical protein
MATGKALTVSEFRRSLSTDGPPSGASAPLAALWWAAKGDWDAAHVLVQSDDGDQAAWVHAYLHRVEGDSPNASYWYRRAGRSSSSAPLEEEWLYIVTSFLSEGGK